MIYLDSTDDADLKYLVDLTNESTEQWKNVVDYGNFKIYKRPVPNNPSILLKTFAYIDGYLKDEVMDAITNVSIRKQWDKVFTEFQIIEDIPDQNSLVFYMCIKVRDFLFMVFQSPTSFVSDRDFVQKRKMWKDFPEQDSHILHLKSVEHHKCPEKRKKVRANIIISGYFIKTLSYNPPKTFLSIVSQTDIKVYLKLILQGSIPKWLVNTAAQKAPKEWVANLLKGCQMVRQRNKQ